jgi:hypothetical protein
MFKRLKEMKQAITDSLSFSKSSGLQHGYINID